MQDNRRSIVKLAFTIYVLWGSNVYASNCDNLVETEVLNRCLGTEISSANRELNEIYGRFRRALDDANKELLKKAEEVWISSRDKDCLFEAASVAGGTAYQSLYLSCQLDRTKQRTKQIKGWSRLFPTQ